MRDLRLLHWPVPLDANRPRLARYTAGMRHRLLAQGGLYAISNGPRDDLLDVCAAALAGGARLLQYRDKGRDAARRLAEARALQSLCCTHAAALIVNDDIGLALQCGAAGVHLGEDDVDVVEARRRLGADAVIGASCYDSIERARHLAALGADYLAFGAFFPSPTKPRARRATTDLLQAARPLGLPLVAIGGITPDNAPPLVAAGADFLAVITALFGGGDVQANARRFTSLFPESTEIA